MRNVFGMLFLAGLSTVIAGCMSTDPQPAQDEVRQDVASRLGEPAQWPGSTNAAAQAVAGLLQTNLTAESATAIALLNNPSLSAEYEEIGISQADLAQASRAPNPEIYAAADIEYSVAYNLLDLLTLPARKKIAARNLEQAKLALAARVMQLAADTQTAFYTLQAQMELTNRLELIVAVNDAAADFAQRQYNAGNITELALNEQKVSAAQSRLDWMHAEVETEMDREQLSRLLGLSDDQINWQISDELPPLPENELSLTNFELLALNQRFDLAAARSRAESIAAALRLEKHVRFTPVLSVGALADRMPDSQPVTGPALDLVVPVFDQGQPRVARLAAEYRRAHDNYEGLKINICSEVRQAQAALAVAREETEFSQKNLLPLSQSILVETLRHYNAMEVSPYELLLSKEHEQTAEGSSIIALRDYWLARVQLEKAIGGRLPEAATKDLKQASSTLQQ